MADFQVTATAIQWLRTGFMLTMAVVIPTTGFLLQRFTTRALFSAAILLFIAGTALAAVAPTFAVILLARVIQAGGTAIILPLLMTTTLTSVPAGHRGTVMGLNSVVISVAPAIGPTLVGFIMDSLTWRWVFGLMLPFACAAFLLGLAFIRTDGETRMAPLDITSTILSAFGFGGLVYGLASAGAIIDGSFTPVLSLLVGVAALGLFIQRQVRLQRRSNSALLDLRPFRVHNFRISGGDPRRAAAVRGPVVVEHGGHGSAIMNTLQQLAGAAGTAALVAAMTIGAAGASSDVAQVVGTRDAFVVGGILALIAVVCAPLVRRLGVQGRNRPRRRMKSSLGRTPDISRNAPRARRLPAGHKIAYRDQFRYRSKVIACAPESLQRRYRNDDCGLILPRRGISVPRNEAPAVSGTKIRATAPTAQAAIR